MYNYPNYQMSNPYPQTEQNNGIMWVQGLEGAKAYQMSPNRNILLMDSENEGTFYIKVTDNIGMANLRVFNYTEVTAQDVKKDPIDLSEYVKKSELQELLTELYKEVTDEQSISANRSKQQSNPKG